MFEQINEKIFIAVNSLAGKSSFLDNLGIAAAKYLPIIFMAVLIYLWFKKNERKNIVLFAVYSAVIGLVLNYLISKIYFHPRPFMINLGTLLVNHAADASFPSDHTTFMVSIAMLLLFFKETKKIGGVLFVLGIAGGVARIYCGLHFPFDILGSCIVSVIASSSVFLCRGSLEKFNARIIEKKLH